jgi:Zn-dependent peptidase ImmA (M78 family)
MLVKEKAAKDAAEVLDTYWALGFPVDPERIATAIGMLVERQQLRDGTSGMLRVEKDSSPEIFVNANDVDQRQRFTIAHELGHYFERTTSGAVDFNFIDRRGAEYDAHEFYADEFAANLLMPEYEVRARVEDKFPLTRLAQHFGVSLPAMKLRLRRLGLQPA